MHVAKVKGKEAKRRSKLWYARDRAAGICDYFDTEKEAREFAEDFNSNRRRRSHNLPPTNKALKKWSVQLLIRSFMHSGDKLITEANEAYDDQDELVESCRLQDNLSLVLWSFSCDPICRKSLFDFTPQIAEKYVEDQLTATYISNGSEVEKKYAPSTIRRNITAIQNAWKWGRKTFHELSHLENPWKGIRIDGMGRKRQRGLRKGELKKLMEACEKCRGTNRYYIPLAIKVAVDTGMRRQEIFDLTWQDIDFEKRRIHIKHDKNSWRRLRDGMPEDRWIVLPPLSQIELKELESSLYAAGQLPDQETTIPDAFRPPHGKLFMNTDRQPMTGNGFKQAFEEVRDRAGIVDAEPRKRLTPHSLRAAAEMTFRRADMSDKHIDVQKNGIKTNYDVEDDLLEMIQDKLDKAFLGKPLAEALKEWGEYQEGLIRIVKEVTQEGLTDDEAMKKARARLDEEYPKYDAIKAMRASLPSTQARLAEEVT